MVEKPQRALEAQFIGHEVWVVQHLLLAPDVPAERTVVVLAGKLERATAAILPPVAAALGAVAHAAGIDPVCDFHRLAGVGVGEGVRREILAEDAAQALRAVVQIFAERLEAAAFMRRLSKEMRSPIR